MRILPLLSVLMLSTFVARAQPNLPTTTPTPMIAGPREGSAGPVMLEVSEAFRRAGQKDGRTVSLTVGPHDYANVGRFADADDPFKVLIDNSELDAHGKACLERRFPKGTPQYSVFVLGQRKLAVVVNPHNKLRSVTPHQLGQMLAKGAEKTKWDAFGWNPVSVRCYGESRSSWCREVLRLKCMGFTEQMERYTHHGFREFREDFAECVDGDEVIAKVRKDAGGIGFFSYRGQSLKGVKLLSVADEEQGKPVTLAKGANIQRDYPLSEPLLLYLHPSAPPLAREFCEFAASPAAAEVLTRHGLVTPHAHADAEGQARLAAAKVGQGPVIQAAGVTDATSLMDDLTLQYVEAQTVLRMKYAGKPELSAVAEFLDDKELLVLNGRIADKDLKALKPKWEALAAPSGGESGRVARKNRHGAKPAQGAVDERVLCARVVAVVAHSLNKLDALTPEQLKAIFSGKVKDWSVLAALDAGGAFGGTEIHCYGPDAPDPALPLFYQRLGFTDSAGRLVRKKDTAEVLSALSIDPQGIAFVNLAALPDDLEKAGVKLLAVGQPDKAVYPSAETVVDESYPLCERFYVYVHPRASDESRDFVEFVTTFGACDEVFRKHGFLSCALPPIGEDAPTAASTQPGTMNVAPATTGGK